MQRSLQIFRAALLGLLFVGTASLLAAPPAKHEGTGFLPQGFAVGDVTATAAIVWTRLPSGHGRVELDEGDGKVRRVELRARAEDDFTVQVELTELRGARRYPLRVVALDADGKELDARSGELRTAPEPASRQPFSFVMSGDLGGQGYCRHPEQGYAIFKAMRALDPEFFVANGDLIYADSICPPQNPDGQPNLPSTYLDVADKQLDWRDGAATFEAFAAHWRYNRADAHYQDFLAHSTIYTQWDDHEVINDFGSLWKEWPLDPGRPGYGQLVAEGTRALFLFNPIRRHLQEKNRLYRAFSWGPDLELFLVDARSYRSPNDLKDQPSNAKTAFGAAQLTWLKESLRASKATFKVVSNDVPLSLPTGGNTHLYGRDAFANGTSPDFSQLTGFERELIDLLTFLDRENIDNVVFLVTDVHFAMSLRYDMDFDGDGDTLLLHELVAGPLSAVRTQTPFQLDPTLRPTTLFAKGDLNNFLFVRLEYGAGGLPLLRAEIRDGQGVVQEGSRLEIPPRRRDKG